jgi:hypothetical protein
MLRSIKLTRQRIHQECVAGFFRFFEDAMLLNEKRISFPQLASQESVNLSTVWRWSLRGCKGHVLESFNVGGKKFTTQEAFQRWLAAINGGAAIQSETPHQREQAVRRAERRAVELKI